MDEMVRKLYRVGKENNEIAFFVATELIPRPLLPALRDVPLTKRRGVRVV